ncbi:MAG: DNA-processing protein DprA [Bacteroidota bacterium]|nr:DNA-processing protein DprA [Bacteroidota bacterium]
MTNEAAYWITLAHIPGWGNAKINSLIARFSQEYNLNIREFFNLQESDWQNLYGLEPKEIEELNAAKAELPNNAFLAEQLENEGYELIPITSPDYSPALKANLKTNQAPALLYVKGNKQILQEKSVAIVGSRNAAEVSLKFTDNIARMATKNFKVIVSGFAKGVDKQALDSALAYIGQSIIVLPQGIMTFGTGFKTYYKQIVDGDVLVVSTFHPRAPWKVELAMARNPIIYALADEIYVAESSDKGGTWSGVIDGLRKKRKIYVRKAETAEETANDLLIEKGAIPVDLTGNRILDESAILAKELDAEFEKKILELLKSGEYTTKDILKRLDMNWSETRLREFLKTQKGIVTIHKKPLRYTGKQQTLFD